VNLTINVQLDYWFERPCDVLLQVEAAALPEQRVEQADLTASPCDHFVRVPAQDHIGTRIWLRTAGRLLVDYRAAVSIARPVSDIATLSALPPHRLPGDTVQYLLPSRYCPSHEFTDFVEAEFGRLTGGARITAIRDWIAGHVSYVPGASHSETTAVDTFHDGKGVCRDYAHLMITLARAGEVPARIASVYAPGVTPPDFHAVAEVFLDGAWHLVDPTGMAHEGEMAVIGIGRDSGDVAFLTAFGPLVMNSQSVVVEATNSLPVEPQAA
jgi:transglutaminase-like putative cysteine protease